MTDRTTLARLGKLVAVDVATGHPGVNSWTASQVLEAHPAAVLDLIEMLVTEGRKARPNEQLVAAYVYMIGQALEFIRMDLENGQASARELAEAVRRALLQAGTSGRVQPTLLMMILMQFSDAKLDPGAELQRLMAGLVEQIGLEQGSGRGGGDFDAYLKDLVEEVGGDPFALHAQMLDMAGALPADHRTTMGISLLRTGEASAREAVVGWLLDPSGEVRHAVASALAHAARQGAVSGSMLRRLIVLRNWLPETDRSGLDGTIQACRRTGVECASWPKLQVYDALASGIDGAGAQSIFVLAREGRQKAIGCLLVKAGVGVRDAWARHGLTRAEMEEFLDQVEGGMEVFPISLEYVRLAVAHALAVNLASGTMPPFALLDFVETAELQGLQPEALSLERLLAMLEAEADPVALASPAELLARSRAVVDRFGFLESWFEEGVAVEKLLEGKRMARAKRVALVRESLLPEHAAKWGERLAQIALLLHHCEDEEPWQEFFVTAKEVLAGRTMAEIPLMNRVAEVTVDAYSASQSEGRMTGRRGV
ncbi:hypothetical protein AAII07_41480 [Microvirga sp. 0TCS3.31]